MRHELTEADAVGQSIAAIAPTAAVALIVPSVATGCGTSAPIAYLVATAGMLCLSVYLSPFSKRVADAGSLYSYTRESLGSASAVVSGWSLIIAYLCSAAAAAIGVALYSAKRRAFGGVKEQVWDIADVVIVVLIATAMAWRNVRLSSRTMLIIESCSVGLILILFSIPGGASLWNFRMPSVASLRASSIGPGLSLAIFSFVGFESAACLGGELRGSAKSMTRVLCSVVMVSGMLFVLSAATEQDLLATPTGVAPLELLAVKQGVPSLAPFLLIGCAGSFFACVLACITAAARLFMQMARDDKGPLWAEALHSKFMTPHRGVILSGGLIFLMLLSRFTVGASLFEAYTWLADMATIGFLLSYALVVVGTARLRLAEKRQGIPAMFAGVIAGGTITWGCWGLFQDSESLYLRKIPIIFVLAIAIGMSASVLSKTNLVRRSATEEGPDA